MTTPAPEMPAPNWHAIAFRLSLAADNMLSDKGRESCREDHGAIKAWLASQPLAPEGGGASETLAIVEAVSDERINWKLRVGEEVLPLVLMFAANGKDHVNAVLEARHCNGDDNCEPIPLFTATPPAPAREAVAWQWRYLTEGRWTGWGMILRKQFENQADYIASIHGDTLRADKYEFRALFDEAPAAGAVVVDEAAVSRLADFIEDRPAYICLPDDERKRISREYLTAAIGGKP